MPKDKDPLDADEAVRRLQVAVPLQLRSAVAYTLAAGSAVGFEHVGMGPLLWQFAAAELDDARRLVEKLVTLGGSAPGDVPGFEVSEDPAEMTRRLLDLESEAIEALQDVIPTTGHTGPSEALEHRLEHTIMRKQEQVDTLRRALRASER